MMLSLNEAIDVLTGWIPESFRNIDEAIKAIIGNLEKLIEGRTRVTCTYGLASLLYGIHYNRETSEICVNPVAFAFILRDHHKAIKIPYEELLWYHAQHELGHFELHKLNLQPSISSDELYSTIYIRFEDYAVSKFLRNEEYRKIEGAVLRTEVLKRAIRNWPKDYPSDEYLLEEISSNINDPCVIALALALGYVKPEELTDLEPTIMEIAMLIANKMKEVEELGYLISKVHEAWIAVSRRLRVLKSLEGV